MYLSLICVYYTLKLHYVNTGKYTHITGGQYMFITIGFIVGFIAGWWVNEKVENLGEKINPLKWFKK